MCKRFLIGLGVIVSVATIVSCTSETVSVPRPRQLSASLARGGQCDPKTEDCTPCDTKTEQCDGRMTGGGNTVTVGDVKITKGLELHCDIVLSNNLEINWPGGNNWHLTKPITSAICIDDPAVNPEPPPAPFDTFVGEATGSLNGVEGSLIKFTFVDAGEPGGKNDKVAIQIFAGGAGTPLVLDVPLQFTTGGNLQAHFDQPHGQHP